MRELSSALAETVPYMYPDPSKDVKGITEKITKIYQITKNMDVKFDHMQRSNDNDPGLPYLESLLKENFERTYMGMRDGNVEYAKSLIRTNTAYCMACHNRTSNGPEPSLLAAFPSSLQHASWIADIEFKAAARHFDGVVREVTRKLAEKRTDIRPLDLERGTQIALTVATRVKKDPKLANKIAMAVSNSRIASEPMKRGAKVWRRDILKWKSEKPRKATSDETLIIDARKLIADVNAGTTEDAGHDEVKYLRASSLMYDLLRQHPKSEFTAEALYIIGLSQYALQEPGLWNLQDLYFCACINQSPHSRIAEQCFDRYKTSVTLGYSGSSGVHIPRVIRKHLDQMKAKAQAF